MSTVLVHSCSVQRQGTDCVCVCTGGGSSESEGECAGAGAARARAQYVSANCVVFTHYSGDVAAVVDEHFARALSLDKPKGQRFT